MNNDIFNAIINFNDLIGKGKYMTALELAKTIVKILDEKSAQDISMLYVEGKTVLTEYLVICTGTSTTHNRALEGELEFKLGELGEKPLNIEGHEDASWIVLDYNSVMVHVFTKSAKEFYKLDKLWAEAENVDISDLLI